MIVFQGLGLHDKLVFATHEAKMNSDESSDYMCKIPLRSLNLLIVIKLILTDLCFSQ